MNNNNNIENNNISIEDLSKVLLRYGRITTDIEFNEIIANVNYKTRIRTFIYNNKHYYHLMVNGIVNECFELC